MNSTAEVLIDPPSTRPYWIPDGVDFESIPRNLQVAITTLVSPTYEELVLGAAPGLAQSTGVNPGSNLTLRKTPRRTAMLNLLGCFAP
jgi:hypothetical protein